MQKPFDSNSENLFFSGISIWKYTYSITSENLIKTYKIIFSVQMPLIITIMTTSQVLRKSSPGPFSSVVCVLWRVTVEYNSRASISSEDLSRQEAMLRGPGILKSHDNGQSGGSFGGCVRCGFVVSWVLQEFRYSPSPLKIDATYKKTEKNMLFKESLLKR